MPRPGPGQPPAWPRDVDEDHGASTSDPGIILGAIHRLVFCVHFLQVYSHVLTNHVFGSRHASQRSTATCGSGMVCRSKDRLWPMCSHTSAIPWLTQTSIYSRFALHQILFLFGSQSNSILLLFLTVVIIWSFYFYLFWISLSGLCIKTRSWLLHLKCFWKVSSYSFTCFHIKFLVQHSLVASYTHVFICVGSRWLTC